jgi:hypothetical protein
LYSSPIRIRMLKLRRMRVMDKKRKPEGKRSLGRPKGR